MTILLGVFGTSEFINESNMNPDIFTYSRFECMVHNNGLVIDTVEQATIKADSIVFLLDMIQFPINICESITCHELSVICNDESLFNKTVFKKNGKVVNLDRNLVIQKEKYAENNDFESSEAKKQIS